MKLSMKVAQKRLATIWFVGAAMVFLVLLVKSLHLGPAEPYVTALWAWFLPTVSPALSLIVGVLVMEARRKKAQNEVADTFLFRVCVGVSILYLLVVLAPVLLEPFTPPFTQKAMQVSQVWLSTLQGIATAVLGAFFVKR